jgi:hypothetical protein
MYTLFNNIVSDTIHSIVVCVDFLGTHMASLVLFLKLGVTKSKGAKANKLWIVTPIFKEQMECIPLCAPRDQSHISWQI